MFLIHDIGAGLELTSLGPMVLEAGFSGATVEDMRVTGMMSELRDSRGWGREGTGEWLGTGKEQNSAQKE